MIKRITVFMMIAIFALGSMAVAQSNAAQCKRGGKGVLTRTSAKLGLTEEQMHSIAGIVVDFHAQAKQIRQSTMTQDEKKSKIQTLRHATKASINGVLTADQREKAIKMKFAERLLQPKPAFGITRFLAKLNLSDQQKSEIKGVMKSCREQMKAVRSDATLSVDAKKAKIKEIRQANIANIKSVLNADQLQKLEEIMNRPKHQGRNAAK